MRHITIRAAAVITALLLWAVCASARQQNVRSISGTVIDAATEKPIEFATVALIAPDSTIVNGTTTDSAGHFTIERIPSGEYKLMAAFIGYTSLITDLNAVPARGAVLALEPDAEMLEEAVVTARRPVIEQKLDKLVMNISDAVSTEGSNGTDLLRKAPGVTIDFDGNVKLNGSAVAVWIDGRPSNLSGKELEVLLQSTDGTTIDRIEIMAHPSAKYDAAGGGGIINIVTKKNFMQGFNGSVNLGYGGMYFDRWDQSGDGSVNLNYRGRKTNTFLTYSARYDDMTAEMLSKSLYGAANEYTMSNSSQLLMRNFNQMFRAGNDWYISDKDVLGAIVTGTFRNSSTDTYGNNFTEHLLGEDILGRLNSEITNTYDFNGVSANLNYTHTFDPAKMQELTLNADYSWYDIGNTSRQSDIPDPMITALIPLDSTIFRQDAAQRLQIWSAKADYQQLFWQTGLLEAGLKWSRTVTDNNSVREDFYNNIWNYNSNLSNIFLYDEQIVHLRPRRLAQRRGEEHQELLQHLPHRLRQLHAHREMAPGRLLHPPYQPPRIQPAQPLPHLHVGQLLHRG